jgi:hypothetical protein
MGQRAGGEDQHALVPQAAQTGAERHVMRRRKARLHRQLQHRDVGLRIDQP